METKNQASGRTDTAVQPTFGEVDGHTPTNQAEATALENPAYREYRKKLRDRGYLSLDSGVRPAV